MKQWSLYLVYNLSLFHNFLKTIQLLGHSQRATRVTNCPILFFQGWPLLMSVGQKPSSTHCEHPLKPCTFCRLLSQRRTPAVYQGRIQHHTQELSSLSSSRFHFAWSLQSPLTFFNHLHIRNYFYLISQTA